ncbi:MAG TPA: hypothetical protein VJR23_15335, partial [Candidatus Acidoferrales bacterium]|nr:hypothetical protein [Candidatus Acidoferrales bacterium]
VVLSRIVSCPVVVEPDRRVFPDLYREARLNEFRRSISSGSRCRLLSRQPVALAISSHTAIPLVRFADATPSLSPSLLETVAPPQHRANPRSS